MKERFPILLALVVAVLGVAAYSMGWRLGAGGELHGTALENPVSVADVSLRGAGGETVSLGDFAGKHLLVFFGFTSCPDVCPLTMARLADSYRALGEPDDLVVVLVTVDPVRDTPEVVDDYARGFHPSFVGLGGSNEEIARAAKRFFVGYGGDGQETLIHTEMVLLVDTEGRFRAVYGTDDLPHLADDLAGLLAGGRLM